MRIKIDKTFVEALKKAINNVGGQSELSRRTGVSQSTINSIINPKKGRSFATDAVFHKLMVVVQNYLPEEAVNNYNNYGNVISGGNNGTAIAGNGNAYYGGGSVPQAVDRDLLLATMQGMSPEEKARFLKEFYAR